MAILLVLAIAFVIDFAVGEPPRVIHPVVGMGRLVSFLTGRGAGHSPRVQFACGCGITLLTVAAFAVPAYFLLSYLGSTSPIAYVIVGALLLKSTFSLRELRRVALGIKGLLEKGKLDEARSGLRARGSWMRRAPGCGLWSAVIPLPSLGRFWSRRRWNRPPRVPVTALWRRSFSFSSSVSPGRLPTAA
jgi:cobalamin biosynthesis protein CobD/CbiB